MYGLKSLDRLVKCHARWWLGKNKEARVNVTICDLFGSLGTVLCIGCFVNACFVLTMTMTQTKHYIYVYFIFGIP